MALQLVDRTDPNTHECDSACVTCGRKGCTHCHLIHRDHADECLDASCDCIGFAVGEPCTTCDGSGWVEEHHWAVGDREVRCPGECNDGVI